MKTASQIRAALAQIEDEMNAAGQDYRNARSADGKQDAEQRIMCAERSWHWWRRELLELYRTNPTPPEGAH